MFAQTCLNYNLHITVYLVVLLPIFLCVVIGRISLKYCGNDRALICKTDRMVKIAPMIIADGDGVDDNSEGDDEGNY